MTQADKEKFKSLLIQYIDKIWMEDCFKCPLDFCADAAACEALDKLYKIFMKG